MEQQKHVTASLPISGHVCCILVTRSFHATCLHRLSGAPKKRDGPSKVNRTQVARSTVILPSHKKISRNWVPTHQVLPLVKTSGSAAVEGRSTEGVLPDGLSYQARHDFAFPGSGPSTGLKGLATATAQVGEHQRKFICRSGAVRMTDSVCFL